TAVEAMKQGAYDYLAKPFDNDKFRILVANALRLRALARENRRLRRQVDERVGLAAIAGRSVAVERVREQVRLASRSDAAVMVLGETGTGKELAARAIHALGPRAEHRFVAVNCGALPENLVESELFGLRRGAFTGAHADRDGRFVEADAGTLFLDEITEMQPEAQVKLLRVLESGEVRPLGGTAARRVDVRVISASNRNLEDCVREGRLREDLYYRLNVFSLRIPPLRERREDIPVLVEHFLGRRGLPPELVGPDVLELLAGHDFPGNIRELENVIESGLILSQGRPLAADDVADRLIPGEPVRSCGPPLIPDEGVSLHEVERNYLAEVLAKTGGNQSRAARLLGISRATLIYRMKKHGLDA
ncbi:MAG TPA: sigma-54-dependent Fis family transcriptional regulator, partial [candidate division WOR-3 bacterium]|nr:sigma-54-dependent Fis family transcriptional regulator [candidate division WOR-3 bacterium]